MRGFHSEVLVRGRGVERLQLPLAPSVLRPDLLILPNGGREGEVETPFNHVVGTHEDNLRDAERGVNKTRPYSPGK